MSIKAMYTIPDPAIRRLIQTASLLQCELERGKEIISSTQIGKYLGVEANTIRKDINYLGGAGDATLGYNIVRLSEKIKKHLMLETQIKACIVGLGRLGEALINYQLFKPNNVEIVAAFDENINKLETLKSNVPLYPAYEMNDIIKSRGIEVAILSVPLVQVDNTLDKLTKCGIKGILNYTGATLPHQTREGIHIRNLDIIGEMNMLKVLLKKELKKT
jgi:redox-sensing transcriptional repressor